MRRRLLVVSAGIVAALSLATGCIFGVDTSASSSKGTDATALRDTGPGTADTAGPDTGVADGSPVDQFESFLIGSQWASLIEWNWQQWSNPEAGWLTFLEFPDEGAATLRVGPYHLKGEWSASFIQGGSGDPYEVTVQNLSFEGCSGGPRYDEFCKRTDTRFVQGLARDTKRIVVKTPSIESKTVLDGKIVLDSRSRAQSTTLKLAFAHPEASNTPPESLVGTWSAAESRNRTKLVATKENNGVVSVAVERGLGSNLPGGDAVTYEYWGQSYWGFADPSGGVDVPLLGGQAVPTATGDRDTGFLMYPSLRNRNSLSTKLICSSGGCDE